MARKKLANGRMGRFASIIRYILRPLYDNHTKYGARGLLLQDSNIFALFLIKIFIIFGHEVHIFRESPNDSAIFLYKLSKFSLPFRENPKRKKNDFSLKSCCKTKKGAL